MKGQISLLLVAGFLLVLTLGLASGVSSADQETETERICSACHSTKRICLNLGLKNRSAWKDTVTRMVRNGAQLPLSRVDEVTDHLSGMRPGQGPLCR